MADEIIIKRIQIRRGNTSEWETANPVLFYGEYGLETRISGKVALKIGDGVTNWSILSYLINQDDPTSGNGADGLSAYEIWLSIGNTGTEHDFIDSLKGVKGDKGDPGDPSQGGLTEQQVRDIVVEETAGLATEAYVNNAIINISGGDSTPFTFDPAIKLQFDKNYDNSASIYSVTSAITIVTEGNNSKVGKTTILYLKSDGVNGHGVLVNGASPIEGINPEFDPIADTVYVYYFECIGNGRIKYDIVDKFVYTGPVVLSAPANFTATSSGLDTISLAWDAVTDALGYKLYYNTDNSSNKIQINGVLSQSTNSFLHTGRTQGTDYYYFIESIGDESNFLTSGQNSAHAKTDVPVQLDPRILSAQALSQTALRFSWTNDPLNNGYKIRLSSDGGVTWGLPIDLAQDTTYYDVTGLTQGTRRYAQLLTEGNGYTILSSGYSATAWAETSNITPLDAPVMTSLTSVSSTVLAALCSQVSGNNGYDWYKDGVFMRVHCKMLIH